MDRRVFLRKGATIKDLSDSVDNVTEGSEIINVQTGTDELLIGTYLPFNHLYWMFDVVNTEDSVVSVQFWSDRQWRDVIDLVDLTNGFSKNEIIKWSIPKDYSWPREPFSYKVAGLGTTEIYDLYWLKITVSADLLGTTELKYLGQKYSSDSDLYSYYPDLKQPNLMKQYSALKTGWDDQSISAAENIQLHLKTKHIIKTADQILNPDLLKLASIHKTAEIIYGAFGEAYRDDKKQAGMSFSEAINQSFFGVDANANARLDGYDRAQSVRWLSR